MAGETTALAKPVMGTSVPAPATLAMWSKTPMPLSSAAANISVTEVSVPASSSGRPAVCPYCGKVYELRRENGAQKEGIGGVLSRLYARAEIVASNYGLAAERVGADSFAGDGREEERRLLAAAEIKGGILVRFAAREPGEAVRVPNEVGDALRNRYPNAQYIEWELEYGYYVASFRSDGFEVEAWYDTSATWRMSSTEIVYKLLSEGIQSTIGEKGYYANNVEDIHKIERPYFCTHYYIELSQTEMICIESGQLLAHSNDLPDPCPIEVPENIMQELGIAYTEARVIEATQISENVWEILYYDTNGTQTIINKLTAEGELLKELPDANIK